MLFPAVLCTAVAFAEESEFVGADAPDQTFEEAETELSAELGGTYASGNVNYYVINGGLNGAHRWDRNKLGLMLFANIGSGVADGDGDGRLNDAERDVGLVENTKRYGGEARYDRFLSTKESLYVLGGALVDPFAGYDLRSHEQIGYSRILVDNDTTNLVTELGFDYAQEDYVDGIDPDYADIFAARVMVGFKHAFNENVAFEDKLELYENVQDFEDFRALNTATLSNTLSDNFSLKLSHQLIFDNVPVEGFEPLDQITMVTLVASLL